MRRHRNQEGFAMILLIGIMATLAILASMLVLMLGNEQQATFKERASKTSQSYAEAGLNSAISGLENDGSWTGTTATPFTPATNQTQYNEVNGNYATLSGAPTVTYLVYDNASPVNYSTNYDANGDGEVWVQATTTYNGRTTTVRQLMQSYQTVSAIPYAAAWTDTNMTLNGTSNIYSVNADGTPDTSGAPYQTSVMVGGNFTANSSTTLASPADSSKTQSVGLQVNGTVSTPGHSFNKTTGGDRDAQRLLRPGSPGGADDAGPDLSEQRLVALRPHPPDRLYQPVEAAERHDLQLVDQDVHGIRGPRVQQLHYAHPQHVRHDVQLREALRQRQLHHLGQRDGQRHLPVRERDVHRQWRHHGHHRPVRASLLHWHGHLERRHDVERPAGHDSDDVPADHDRQRHGHGEPRRGRPDVRQDPLRGRRQ